MSATDEYVDFDLACRGCGYNLRGTPVTGVCPECGMPVADSLPTDRLVDADVDWLAKVRRGVTVLLVAILAAIPLSLLAALVDLALGLVPTPGPGSSNPPLTTISPAITVTTLALAVAYALGLWGIGEPEPGGDDGPASRVRLRRMVAIALVLAVLGMALSVASTALQSQAMMWASAVVSLPGVVVWVVLLLSLYAYGRHVAMRVPDPALDRSTAKVRKGMIWSAVAMIAACVLLMGGLLSPAVLLWCGGWLAFVVFAIWSLVLLFRYRNRLTTAIDEARRRASGGAMVRADTPWAS